MFLNRLVSILHQGRFSVDQIKILLTRSDFGRMMINAGWLGSAMPVTMVSGILRAGLLARILGTTGLGIYGLIIGVTGVLSLIVGFTSAQALLTFANRYIQENDTRRAAQIVQYCFFIDFSLSVVGYAAVLLVAFNFSKMFNVPEASRTALMVYGLVMIFHSTLMSSISVLHLCDCFKYDFVYKVLRSSVLLGIVAVIFIAHGGLMSVIISEVIISACSGLPLFLVALRVLHSKGIYLTLSDSPWWKVPGEVWKFQFLGYLRGAVMGIHRHAGILILGYLTFPAEVGLYHAARRFTDPIRNTSGFFSQSLYPAFGRLWFSAKYRELRSLFKRSALLFIALGIMTSALLIPFTKSIISLIYGEQFVGASSAASVLLLCATVVIIAVPLSALLPAIGRNEVPLFAGLIMVIFQAILLFLLVPTFGSVGAAASFLGALIAGNIFFLLPQTISIVRMAGKHFAVNEIHD